jgi:hypothetical protein
MSRPHLVKAISLLLNVPRTSLPGLALTTERTEQRIH